MTVHATGKMCSYMCTLPSCLNEDLRYKHFDLLPLWNWAGNFSDPLPAFLSRGSSSEPPNTDYSDLPRLLLNFRRQRRKSDLHTTDALAIGIQFSAELWSRGAAPSSSLSLPCCSAQHPHSTGTKEQVRKSRNLGKRRDACLPSLLPATGPFHLLFTTN